MRKESDVHFRVTAEEKALMLRMAAEQGRELSEWAREELVAAAKNGISSSSSSDAPIRSAESASEPKPPEPKNEASSEPEQIVSPAEIVAAWEKAGARFGWMGQNEVGKWYFHPGGEGEDGQVLTFRFRAWQTGVFDRLPKPQSAFGLLILSNMSDEWLKELAGLKFLQILFIDSALVTDAGLKVLAELKSLQTVYLRGTKVTEAGVAELRKALPGVSIQI